MGNARTGVAHLPLHSGKAPAWLFTKMTELAREVTLAIVHEFGPQEMLRRLSDPLWFQAFGCVLGFDWHSSGVTTTVCGALKEGLRGLDRETGIFVAGGKGGTSRKTPSEIEKAGDRLSVDPATLVYASRMVAKVDSAGVQDGYELYHHSFIFTQDGLWTVVQQGMNKESKYARRYHWLSETAPSFVVEPHQAICCDRRGDKPVLNMVARESAGAQATSVELVREDPKALLAEMKRAAGLSGAQQLAMPMQLDATPQLDMPRRHHIEPSDVYTPRLEKIVRQAHEKAPASFEELLGTEGVGAKTIRALSLVSELLYGAGPSFEDPARFSFAHGGKDGHPFPVDRETYRGSIDALQEAVRRAKLGQTDKLKALRRLHERFDD